MRLAQLRELAEEMNLPVTDKMRRPELIDAIRAAGGGGKRGRPRKTETEAKQTPQTPAGSAKTNGQQPQKGEGKPQEHGKEDAHASRGNSRRRRNQSAGEANAKDIQLDVKKELGSQHRDNKHDQHKEGDYATSDSSSNVSELSDIKLPSADNKQDDSRNDGRNSRRRNRNNDNNRDDDRGGRRRRGRDRGKRRNGRDDAPEIREDDVLIPIGGILDVQENHAFIRTSGYLQGPNDVYVTLGNVRRWNLRPGDAVVGAVRQPRENERPRQRYNALVKVDTVNGLTVDQAGQRREFNKLTPLYPTEQLRLETTPKAITPRIIDLVSPIGKGQRGLIVSPPKAGKTTVMQQIANAIAQNNPEVHLMVVLVDERPEEVTDMQRTVKGEVIASTFDRPATDHTAVAELAIERAKRLVELGQDVVVLLDSLTRLGRAYNLASPASGRILSGGVDASALFPPKRFFGAARNIEEGGSLTIVASALVETGSKMDEVIFEEFKGTGNMELRLSRDLAERRIFPAVDVNASGTRREEVLFKKEELQIMWRLRRVLGTLEQQPALELVLDRLKDTQSNAEFLMMVAKTMPNK
ncbi:transcription termination factor Rho [Gleimia hominis]|uniref:Transcription termination factor Rho n=1 Tax=Gleimia hominis TaxID=595468 RepID=A0ABU3IAJ0_9ACTO|nr:transcription termination factor Rho [Gleimia hominis]MDT3767394.1 transcription termination factor Rho [Gleimia hominis]